ncbi:hypothetical protein PP460_gp073 [Streptomyces phage Muntaha]|uniref:Uncharacterized protein n=1 Tax=Streptomyces phage Muntaha TaxID=2713269 RepID=A0A6G8R3F7_9CAUD|nr:hypothetical protein PP460_gp073 [Streptomyces phage Muntaha]QIN94729.1 hypothetical protein SEA_MUNTAHA_205 [Streptomyces phage Muntaha]
MAEKPGTLAGFLFFVFCCFAALAVLVGSVIFAIKDSNDWQEKQDACLKAGGMYIDNRGTDPYCFFNK